MLLTSLFCSSISFWLEFVIYQADTFRQTRKTTEANFTCPPGHRTSIFTCPRAKFTVRACHLIYSIKLPLFLKTLWGAIWKITMGMSQCHGSETCMSQWSQELAGWGLGPCYSVCSAMSDWSKLERLNKVLPQALQDGVWVWAQSFQAHPIETGPGYENQKHSHF